jgi:hypothetical protein
LKNETALVYYQHSSPLAALRCLVLLKNEVNSQLKLSPLARIAKFYARTGCLFRVLKRSAFCLDLGLFKLDHEGLSVDPKDFADGEESLHEGRLRECKNTILGMLK